jgi:hypothetical protein
LLSQSTISSAAVFESEQKTKTRSPISSSLPYVLAETTTSSIEFFFFCLISQITISSGSSFFNPQTLDLRFLLPLPLPLPLPPLLLAETRNSGAVFEPLDLLLLPDFSD